MDGLQWFQQGRVDAPEQGLGVLDELGFAGGKIAVRQVFMIGQDLEIVSEISASLCWQLFEVFVIIGELLLGLEQRLIIQLVSQVLPGQQGELGSEFGVLQILFLNDD